MPGFIPALGMEVPAAGRGYAANDWSVVWIARSVSLLSA